MFTFVFLLLPLHSLKRQLLPLLFLLQALSLMLALFLVLPLLLEELRHSPLTHHRHFGHVNQLSLQVGVLSTLITSSDIDGVFKAYALKNANDPRATS